MYLETHFDQHMALSDNKKINLGNENDLVNLFLETYNCGLKIKNWLIEQENVIKKNL